MSRRAAARRRSRKTLTLPRVAGAHLGLSHSIGLATKTRSLPATHLSRRMPLRPTPPPVYTIIFATLQVSLVLRWQRVPFNFYFYFFLVSFFLRLYYASEDTPK